jgi:hypothetical protein
VSSCDDNNGGNRATVKDADNDVASGGHQRGSRWVAIYRVDGRQRKEFAATFREAREIKIRRTAEEAGRRAGPTLHAYALQWVDHYAGRGANDVINDRTRREYRRLLITYALAYFEPGERLRDIDEQRARSFVDRLCRLTDETGHRLCDRSVHNAVLPLQCCLRHAARAGLLGDGAEPVILLPRRRRGRAYEFDERAFSRVSSLRGCWLRSPTAGARSSSCSRRPVCGSPRRSRCGSRTSRLRRSG